MVKENELFEYRVGSSMPFGVTKVPEGVQFAVYLPKSKDCFLKLYKKGRKTPVCVVALTEKFKVGGVYFVTICKSALNQDTRSIEEILTEDYEYMYEADGEEFVDPYADYITGREQWGRRGSHVKPVRGGICLHNFDWKDDMPLRIPYSDLILYQLHVRGYTKHSSSKVTHKGTFRGLMEKLPYLKELGINGVLLLPVYEFCEVSETDKENRSMEFSDLQSDGEEQKSKVNYWGYGTKNTYYFAPKAAYSSGLTTPSDEFKEMVQAFHENGIEVLLDIYFTPGTNLFLMTDCLRSWVLNYHVDGFRINQEVMPSITVASDPILSGVKILASYWDMDMLHSAGISGQKNALAEYNEGFMNDARRFLKSDEGMVERMVNYFSRNPKEHSVVNFITHVNGFTMMDLVSYDVKHNQDNGEMNQDGTEFNYSWNCGVEGKTRKKTILDRRMIQIRNAFLMLMTSQGTPMILAGDELGHTQLGNNNAYCQDNIISWLDWTRLDKYKEIHDFVRYMIAFRKKHAIIRKRMKPVSCQLPEISIHNGTPFNSYTEYNTHMIGVMFAGRDEKDSKDDIIFYCINTYWEPLIMQLPVLPNGMKWVVDVNTYCEYEDGKDFGAYTEMLGVNTLRVPARTTIILVAE